MAGLVLKNIEKKYSNGFVAVQDFNLDIADKEFIIFVGPSGCGKSTALRMIAGLEDISEGDLYIGDQRMNGVAPKDRDIAMVFRHDALYPRMSVFDNMAFGLKLRKTPKDLIKKRVTEAARVLDLEQLLDSKPKALSGGQRQRVTMGRAVARDPKVFLMDDPLSNLDTALRAQMRTELSRLHERLQTTFIYVTHDQTEAMTMGKRVVVLKDGVIQQVDSPANLYNKPANLFVAGFIGTPQMNFLEAAVSKTEAGVFLSFESQSVRLGGDRAKALVAGGYIGKEIVMGVRPENLHSDAAFVRAGLSDNVFEAEAAASESSDGLPTISLLLNDTPLTALAGSAAKPAAGSKVRVAVDCDHLFLFDKETEAAIQH